MTATPDRAAFLAERSKGIGGSDVASLFSVGYGCRRRLWYEKTDTPADFERETTNAMELGNVLEPFFAEKYVGATGRVLSPVQSCASYDHPELRVNVDRLISPDEDSAPWGVLEIKSVGREVFYKTKRNGLWEDAILQLQHGMLVWGLTHGSFAIGSRDSGELLYWDVDADPAIHEAILREGPKFWALVRQHITAPADAYITPPALEPDDRRCQDCAWRVTCHGNAFVAAKTSEYQPDESLAPLVREYIERRDARKQAEDALEETKAELQYRLGDRTMVSAAGAKVQFYTIHKQAYTVAAHDERPLRIYPGKRK